MAHSRNPRAVCYPCSLNCSVFLTPVSFFITIIIKEVVGHKQIGKKVKLSIRHSQILLRFVRQVARGVACHATFTAK